MPRVSTMCRAFRVSLYLYAIASSLFLMAATARAQDAGVPPCPLPDETPTAAAICRSTGAAFAPGQYVDLDAPLPNRRPASAGETSVRVCFQHGDDAPVCEAKAERLSVRQHYGVKLPPLPKGAYAVWYESGSGRGAKQVISVVPRLVSRVIRPEGFDRRVEVEIRADGPSTTVRLDGEDAQLAFLSNRPAAPIPVEAGGTARFSIDLKECGRAVLNATAPEYAPATVYLTCRPTTPIPVVFVPGTAGSELDLIGDTESPRYWIAREIFKVKTLSAGRLGEEGEDLPGREMAVGGVLNEVSIVLKNSLEKTLGHFVLMASPVPCDKSGVPVPESDKRAAGTCPAFMLPIYRDFLDWAKESLTPAQGSASPAFYTAPYDWRKGAAESNISLLDKVVEEALDKAPGHDKVIIVTHSLGGLVSRAYLAGRGRGKVAALIAVGTPWLGAPKTARGLLWGYNFGLGYYYEGNGDIQAQDAHNNALQTKAHNALGISFLNLEDAREAARTWPAVFLQLPTSDFMKLYGAASGSQDVGKSVIWNWSPAETIKFYEEGSKAYGIAGNRSLFRQASQWRDEHMFRRDDYGVSHHLIAAFTDENTKFDSLMDMQMAKPDDKRLESPLALISRRSFDKFLRPLLKTVASPLAKVQIYVDKYYPVDTENVWGDATAPLLSASAGAQTKGDPAQRTKPDEAVAQQILGEDTHIKVIQLDRGLNHGSMLSDPKVLWEVWQIYRRQNQSLGVQVNPQVRTITIELERKLLKLTPVLVFKLAGYGLEQCVDSKLFQKSDQCSAPADKHKQTGNPFGDPDKVIMHFHKELVTSPADAEPETTTLLRMNDLIGKTIKISLKSESKKWKDKPVKGKVGITHLRLLINGMEVLNQDLKDSPKVLSKDSYEWESQEIRF